MTETPAPYYAPPGPAHDAEQVYLLLDWPPVGWRPQAARAEQYRRDARRFIEQAPPAQIVDPVHVRIRACAPDGRILNPWRVCLEPVLDVLANAAPIIRHPSLVQSVSIERGAVGRPGYVEVWLQPEPNGARA